MTVREVKLVMGTALVMMAVLGDRVGPAFGGRELSRPMTLPWRIFFVLIGALVISSGLAET